MDHYLNDTSEDVFGDLDVGNDTDKWPYQETHLEMIVYSALGIIDFLVDVASVLANVLVIYAVCKFPKLKTEVNSIILNYSACHLTYMIIDPVFSLFHALVLDRYIGLNWYCTVFQIEESMLTLHFAFVGLLAADCYIKVCRPSLAGRYRTYFKTVHHVLYALGFLYAFVSSITCFIHKNFSRSYMMVVAYCVVALVIVAVRVAFYVNTRKGNPPPAATEFPLTICTIFLAFWTPLWILHTIHDHLFEAVVVIYIFKILAFCNPTFNVYLYARLNKHFRVAYHKIYRCQVQNYDDDFEDSVGEVGANNSTVEIITSSGGGGGGGGNDGPPTAATTAQQQFARNGEVIANNQNNRQ